MRVLGLSGSLRRDSYNTRLLKSAAHALPADVELTVWDRLAELPHYNADDDVEPVNEVVADLREQVNDADAIVIATPEYNGSIPGPLKNAIDWASRPRGEAALKGKPAVVIGASTGMFGAVWAQADARKVLGIAGARVVGSEEFPVPAAHEAFHGDHQLRDDDQSSALAELLEALVSEVAPAAA